jgi:predicted N-acetyltransferase YhbS
MPYLVKHLQSRHLATVQSICPRSFHLYVSKAMDDGKFSKRFSYIIEHRCQYVAAIVCRMFWKVKLNVSILCVKEEYKGSGIGTYLVKRVLHKAKLSGLELVTVSPDP